MASQAIDLGRPVNEPPMNIAEPVAEHLRDTLSSRITNLPRWYSARNWSFDDPTVSADLLGDPRWLPRRLPRRIDLRGPASRVLIVAPTRGWRPHDWLGWKNIHGFAGARRRQDRVPNAQLDEVYGADRGPSPSHLPWGDQSGLVGEDDGLDAIAQVEFGEYPSDVDLDGSFG